MLLIDKIIIISAVALAMLIVIIYEIVNTRLIVKHNEERERREKEEEKIAEIKEKKDIDDIFVKYGLSYEILKKLKWVHSYIQATCVSPGNKISTFYKDKLITLEETRNGWYCAYNLYIDNVFIIKANYCLNSLGNELSEKCIKEKILLSEKNKKMETEREKERVKKLTK